MADKAAVERDDDDIEDGNKPDPEVREDDNGGVVVSAPTRKDRRNQWRANLENETKTAKEEAARARREMEETRAELARIREEMRQPRVQAKDEGKDQHESELESIREQMETIQSALRSGGVTTMEEAERLRKQFYRLDDRREQIKEERLEKRLASKMPTQGRDAETETTLAILQGEFPEVFANREAAQYASGIYTTLRARGKPANLATSREAMRKAAEDFGLGASPTMPQPSASHQQRFGSVPAQAGSKTSGAEIRLDAAQKKMAVARWPSDDEHVAYKKMADLLRKQQSESQSQE